MHNQKLIFTKRAKLQDITVMKYLSTFSNLVGALYRKTNLSEIDSHIINFLPSFLPWVLLFSLSFRAISRFPLI
jgi:hypothetical protein